MKPLSLRTPKDSGTAEVEGLGSSTRARLLNQTDEPVVIPPRVPPPDGETTKPVVLPPRGSIELEFEVLARYDVQPLIEARSVRRLLVEPFVKVTNKTARRIWIAPHTPGESGSRGLVIPAFGTRQLGAAALRRLNYEAWVDHNLIGVAAESAAPTDSSEGMGAAAIFALSWVLAVSFVPSLFGWSPTVGQRWVLGIVGFYAILFFMLWVGSRARSTGFGTLFALSFNLGVLMLVAVGVPLGATLLGGVVGGGAPLTLSEIASDLPQLFRLTLMALLVLLPGLLYFQYERQRVAELGEKFLRDIMLLNPNVRTIDDARITYGSSIDEVSGAVGADSRQFWLGGRGRPILVSTLLFALGWVYLFQRDGVHVGTVGSAMIIAVDVFSFAFLGGYFFAIQLLFRRYARGDLTPKVYGHVAVRIACAMVAAWLLGALPEEGWAPVVLPLAFICGIVPETAVALARDVARKAAPLLPSLNETHPITDLEGVNLYDRVRLLEEGVENVENLAHHDIIELMLRSRIPTPRLVDLVDQAILYLHVRGEDGAPRAPLRKLRSLGIRTASDLVLACEALDTPDAKSSIAAGAASGATPKRELLLGVLGPAETGSPRALEVILCALQDDEWFGFVSHWRKQGGTAGFAYTLESLIGAQRMGASGTAGPGPVDHDFERAEMVAAD